MFYCVRGELETARGLAEQLLRLAQHLQDSTLFLRAHTALGNVLLFLEEFTLVRAHAEQGIALYDPQQHSFQTSLSWGPDPGLLCLSRASEPSGRVRCGHQGKRCINAPYEEKATMLSKPSP